MHPFPWGQRLAYRPNEVPGSKRHCSQSWDSWNWFFYFLCMPCIHSSTKYHRTTLNYISGEFQTRSAKVLALLWKRAHQDDAHHSKHPRDLKQNGTQKETPFSGTVFNTLSHGVVRFVASVSSKNHLLTGWNSLRANQKLLFNGFLS